MESKLSELEKTHLNNRRSILRQLRIDQAVARIDLAKKINLSAATVTEITSALIKEGLVRETSGQTNRGGGRGRPKVLIELAPSFCHVLGIKLTLDQIDIALGDFTGKIIHSKSHRVKTLTLESQPLVALLRKLIDDFIAVQPKKKFVSIGVAVQGVADTKLGTIAWSYAFAGRDMPLGESLQKIYNCPVTLLNDANAIALALQQQTRFNRHENMAVIMLGYGVGMGLILNGKLYNGAHGAAGEFGHSKFYPDGAICNCGKRGCVEAYAGDYAIYRDAARLAGLPATESLHPTSDEMLQVTSLAREGNHDVINVFRLAGRALGYGIANLIAFYSPEKILISGSGISAYDLLEKDIHNTVAELLVPELRKDIEINAVPWRDDLTEVGAIKSALLHWEDQGELLHPGKLA